MSRIRILFMALGLAAVVGSALLFSPVRRYLPIDNDKPEPPVEAGRAATPASSRSPANNDKPAPLVESLAAALTPSPRSAADHDKISPAFDVVTIDPSGDAVIAGRAAPGAVVELLRDGKPLDRAVADQSGNFVMTPSQLPAGNYELKLRSAQPDGKQEISKETVTVAVFPGRKDQPVVPRHAPDRESIVLSKPAAQKPVNAAVTLDAIEAGQGGKLYVEGRGTPGATVRLYLNDSYLASSKASTEGSLKFAVDGGVRPGEYRIRLEEVDSASSAVKSRAETPFIVTKGMVAADVILNQTSTSVQAGGTSRTTPLQDAIRPQLAAASPKLDAEASAASSNDNSPSVVVVPAIKTTVVTRGDSLWRISQQTYGNGTKYPVIYHANQRHIGNPNLIYPSQIFVLPEPSP